jgi:hypothetical protein
LTPRGEFAPIAKVKYPAPLLPTLAALVFALTACRTTSNRFDLYQMDRPHGPGTTRLRGMTLGGRYDHGSSVTTYNMPASGAAPAAAATGPVAPPPPPPPPENTPESSVGAPQPTPLPEAVPVVPPPAEPGSAPGTVPVAPPPAAPPGAITPPPAAPPADSSASPNPVIPGLSQ